MGLGKSRGISGDSNDFSGLPGKPEKADLGRHCFSYCALLAGEFYFSAASADPKTGTCGCDAPVADVLGLKVD